MERLITLTVRMTERDHARLQDIAKEKDLPMSRAVRQLVREEHERVLARAAVRGAVR